MMGAQRQMSSGEFSSRAAAQQGSRINCDVLVIGAGPGGLAAAKGAREAGAGRVMILERDTCAGGILNQCIHDGFGLIRYREQLTGPEYAMRAAREAEEAGARLLTGHQVVRIEPAGTEQADPEKITVTAVSSSGLKTFCAGAVVMALGCRERTRGAITIPGSRPAGVFTAGVVQNFVNIRNIMPGRRVVILGSGDVGMIMARRLTLEGAHVEAVVEVLPEPAGLARNVSQCLYDFGIPILCSHTISKIIGRRRLEAVEIAQIDERMKPVPGTEKTVPCDALVLSVGLIPENEIAEGAGVSLDVRTNGTLTDAYLQTNVPGIFSCGNSRRIMDLADFVSEQGERAGRNAAVYAAGAAVQMQPWDESRSAPMKKGFPEPGTVTCTLCPNGCQVRRVAAPEETAPPDPEWVSEPERREPAQSNGNAGRDIQSLYTGNKCPRGALFAEQERTAPRRVLTTTLRGPGGCLVPVRTERPIAKEALFDVMEELRGVHIGAMAVQPRSAEDAAGSSQAGEAEGIAPVRCGDVLTYVTDSDGTEAAVIATADFDI